jgi:hypothetical protein
MPRRLDSDSYISAVDLFMTARYGFVLRVRDVGATMMSSDCCVSGLEHARGRDRDFAFNRRLGSALTGDLLNIVHLLD